VSRGIRVAGAFLLPLLGPMLGASILMAQGPPASNEMVVEGAQAQTQELPLGSLAEERGEGDREAPDDPAAEPLRLSLLIDPMG
jgi:hypothetical protein